MVIVTNHIYEDSRSSGTIIKSILEIILAAILLAVLVNLITGIIDAFGSGQWTYNGFYVLGVMILFPIVVYVFWLISKNPLKARSICITQILVDTERGEAPYLQFKDKKGEGHLYKPQIALANAFRMMSISFSVLEGQERHGHKVWTGEVGLTGSKRESRIRQRIIDAFVKEGYCPDNPISDLMDTLLAHRLGESRYDAASMGIEEKKVLIVQNRTEKGVGGFQVLEKPDDEGNQSVIEKMPKDILDIQPIFTGSSRSHDFAVQIPSAMIAEDATTEKERGIRIHGGGVDILITHEYVRHEKPRNVGLSIQNESGSRDDSIVAVQYRIEMSIMLSVCGYLHNPERNESLFLWAQQICRDLYSFLCWPEFKREHEIWTAQRSSLDVSDLTDS